MNEYQRACERKARQYAELRAEEEELQELQAQLAQRQRSSEELVYKTFTTPTAQQQSGGMDAATVAAWNAWLQHHVEDALDNYSEYVVKYVAEVIAQERQSMREHVSKELGALKAEVEVLRGVVRSNNVELIKRSQNVG